ncbi:hypothetical protein [Flavobacterium sp. ZS1P14]|uniref:hypothetical protein n=1 Tax=Flavobacterium sp. ZS1P14 TaxID=3401729 RepID=UPI003AABFED0
MKKTSFKSNYKNIEFLCKKIYVWAANFYCWFWIIREIFWRKSTDFESYILWFFLSAGMYFFIRDSKDLDIIYNIDIEEKQISKEKTKHM